MTTETTEIFVILIQDRHADVDAEVWRDKQLAKDRARKLAMQYARTPADYEERQVADWVLHIQYSCEGDCVTVLRKEIQ